MLKFIFWTATLNYLSRALDINQESYNTKFFGNASETLTTFSDGAIEDHLGAWNIERPDIKFELDKSLICEYDSSKFPFTLTDWENSYRSPQRSLEIYGSEVWGEHSEDKLSRLTSPINLSLRVSTLALHDVITMITTRVQRVSDAESRKLVANFKAIIDSEIRILEEMFDKSRLEELRSWDMPCSTTKKGPLSNVDEIYARELKDHNAVIQQIREILDKNFIPFLKNNPSAIKIKTFESKKIENIVVSGGNASGKNNAREIAIEYLATKHGISPSDIIIINTDSYKPYLLDMNQVSPHLFSLLTTDEASLVNAKIQYELEKEHNESSSHFVIYDQAFAGQKRQIDTTLINGGSMQIVTISTDVNSAIQRSYNRGIQTGRFETTKGILKSHRDTTKALPNDLSIYGGQALKHTLIDNNQPPEELSEVIMGINCKDRHIFIYNEEKVVDFAMKTAININAQDERDVYISNEPIALENYLLPFLKEGFYLFTCFTNSIEKIFFSPEYLMMDAPPCKKYKNIQNKNSIADNRKTTMDSHEPHDKNTIHLVGTQLPCSTNNVFEFHQYRPGEISSHPFGTYTSSHLTLDSQPTYSLREATLSGTQLDRNANIVRSQLFDGNEMLATQLPLGAQLDPNENNVDTQSSIGNEMLATQLPLGAQLATQLPLTLDSQPKYSLIGPTLFGTRLNPDINTVGTQISAASSLLNDLLRHI